MRRTPAKLNNTFFGFSVSTNWANSRWTSEVDVHAIIQEVEGELVAGARQEISVYLAERGRSPKEVEQILKRLEQHDVQVVRQVLAEAATDSSLLDVLEQVRGDSLLVRFVSRCGDAIPAGRPEASRA
jgi:hypothetical protein